jgi:ABC-type multidrug transport system fused ATPase/permease subunit
MNWKDRLVFYGVNSRLFLFLVFLSFLAIFAELFSISLFIPVFEMIGSFDGSGNKERSFIFTYVESIFSILSIEYTFESVLVLVFILFLLSKVILYIISYKNALYTGRITKKMKDTILLNYLRVDTSYYDSVSIGDLIHISTTELPQAVRGVLMPIKMINTFVTVGVSVVILFIMSFQLTIVTIFIVLIVIIFPLRWVRETAGAGRKNTKYSTFVTTFLVERLKSPRLIRLSGIENVESCQFEKLTEKNRAMLLTLHRLKLRVNLYIEPVVVGVSLVMLYYAISVLDLSISMVLVYMIILTRLVPMVNKLLSDRQMYNQSFGPMNIIEKLFSELGNNVKKVKRNKLPLNITSISKIALRNVSYSYDSESNSVLAKINLDFNRQTITAIVGPSGSGKSTLVDIVSGYREGYYGDVFIDDINTNKYSQKNLLSLVSYVGQEPEFFKGTIKSHISYGDKNIKLNDVIKYSKLAGSHEFIKKLKDGYDSALFDSAMNLSGGQKQRLDLARALYRDTPILILDEPTGNLDLNSEMAFMETIKGIVKHTEKIIIIIAHRLNTIKNADQIIVLEDGSVTGIGNHSELLKFNSWYHDSVAKI